MNLYTKHHSSRLSVNLFFRKLKKGAEYLKPKTEQMSLVIYVQNLSGFTTVQNYFQPATLIEMLNEYLQISIKYIDKQNGTIIDFEGDRITAVWGLNSKPNYNQVINAYKSISNAVTSFSKGIDGNKNLLWSKFWPLSYWPNR